MSKTYLNVEDVMQQLKIARPTLYAYVNQKKIPFIKIGGKLLFDEHDLTEWVNAKKQPAIIEEKRV